MLHTPTYILGLGLSVPCENWHVFVKKEVRESLCIVISLVVTSK